MMFQVISIYRTQSAFRDQYRSVSVRLFRLVGLRARWKRCGCLRATLQAVGASISNTYIRLSTTRAEAHAPPQCGKRRPNAGALDGGGKGLGEARGELHHVSLHLSRTKATVNQTKKPLGQVAIEPATSLVVQ
jgi:hypothetical protein